MGGTATPEDRARGLAADPLVLARAIGPDTPWGPVAGQGPGAGHARRLRAAAAASGRASPPVRGA